MGDVFYYVYIVTNASRRPLYTGITRWLRRRHGQHKGKSFPDSYSARYGLNRLVYFEIFRYVRNAIAREKQIKDWGREKKVALIESVNPKWNDLSREWDKPIEWLKPEDRDSVPAGEKQDQNQDQNQGQNQNQDSSLRSE